jgi:hypothetical protein
VAISNLYPEAKSTGSWVRGGWHVTLAYVAGFVVMMLVLGWRPEGQPASSIETKTLGQAILSCQSPRAIDGPCGSGPES